MSFGLIKKSWWWFRRFIKGEETFLKTFNRWLIYKEFKEKRLQVKGYPCFAYIDICNYCNLHCPLCPTGQGRHERKQVMMSLELFQRIMQQIGRYLYVVRLDSWGEPFLNRDIFKIIECAVTYKIMVSFSSNLNVLEPGDADLLVKSGLDEIYVSLDGATQATYEIYRRGGSLKKVIENIQQIQEAKRRLRKENPKVTALFLVMRHNQNEIEDARLIAERLKIGFFAGLVRVDTGREALSPLPELIQQAQDWLPTDPRYQRYDAVKGQTNMPRRFCELLWLSTTINPDGSVAPCCAVYPQGYDFENILDLPFKDIWNGKNYVSARSIFGGAPKMPTSVNTVCHICKQNGLLSA